MDKLPLKEKGGSFIFVFLLVAQMVKHLPTMLEIWVRSLGWKYPLEKEMATHSSTLAWKIPWTQSTGSQRVGHDQAASLSLFKRALRVVLH